MKRRTLLKWASSALAALSAMTVMIPGIAFLTERLRRRTGFEARFQRVAKLRDLPVAKPVLIPIVGSRVDAWTRYPSEPIGRVWLVRRKNDEQNQSKPVVDALTSVCPHLGCQVQIDNKKGHFICPCHKAEFSTSGERLSEQVTGTRNHAPRAMDSLACQVVQDEQTNEWWVEVRFEKFELGRTKKVTVT